MINEFINEFEEAVNAIQKLNARVANGKGKNLYAPLMGKEPASIDTMILPIALTDVATGSSIPIDCGGSPAELNLTTTIYVEAWGQDVFPRQKQRAYLIAASWWRIYRSPASYLYNDATTKRLIEEESLKVAMSIDGGVTFSGYRPIPYPEGTQNSYHAIQMTFSVKVRSGGGC